MLVLAQLKTLSVFKTKRLTKVDVKKYVHIMLAKRLALNDSPEASKSGSSRHIRVQSFWYFSLNLSFNVISLYTKVYEKHSMFDS